MDEVKFISFENITDKEKEALEIKKKERLSNVFDNKNKGIPSRNA